MFGMGGEHGHCCHCHGCGGGWGHEEMTPEKKREMLAHWREKLEKKLEMIKKKEAELAKEK
ncbi:MAG: hypothetical protein A3I08_04315 [Candidatus Andersenbacteria bacterium RIFCSPLOWO2_02_FULL_46_11]|nr:MAG: hypothetical protein A3I08_04315 [Candidatus Andersenbacteria bacterium RIFCSPLOWO2_02_FULL_46_11]